MTDRRDSSPAESRTSSPLSSVPPSGGENIVVAGRANAEQQGTIKSSSLAEETRSPFGKSVSDATIVAGGTPRQDQEVREDSAAEPAEPAQPAPATLLAKERALAKKYGSLFAADEEKARRKFAYLREHAQFVEDAKMHQLRAEHMETRNKIWADALSKNEAEIERCGARIKELEGEHAQMMDAGNKMNEDFEGDVEAWKEDQVAMAKYDAYFNLESDELDL